MKTTLLVLVFVAGCTTYDDPWWGDPCEPQTSGGGLQACKHGDEQGYCEPQPNGDGACRPFCMTGPASCEGGAIQKLDPIYAICYCGEP